MSPGLRLLLCTFGLLYAIKAVILWRHGRRLDPWGLALYLSVWPGMDPTPFERRGVLDPALLRDAEARFAVGAPTMAVGIALAAATAVFAPRLGPTAVGWLGIASVLLCVHFGLADLLLLLARAAGFAVAPLFDRPWRSVSLRDFWSRRWNRAFVEMDHILFFTPLRKRFGALGATVGVFAISGLLHEWAISFPAGGGWGAPLGYFLVHGLLARRNFERRWPVWAGRLWTRLWVLAPLPALFHAPFRATLIVPGFTALHDLLCAWSLAQWFSLALWLAGVGHFCLLIASVQVPARLGWRDDLAKLTPFNRKLMWAYGATIVLTIVAFGTLTLALHDQLLAGGPLARGLSLFIGVFWLFRIAIDAFLFRHRDWPSGPAFVVGHALLVALFAALSATYLGLFLWRLGT